MCSSRVSLAVPRHLRCARSTKPKGDFVFLASGRRENFHRFPGGGLGRLNFLEGITLRGHSQLLPFGCPRIFPHYIWGEGRPWGGTRYTTLVDSHSKPACCYCCAVLYCVVLNGRGYSVCQTPSSHPLLVRAVILRTVPVRCAALRWWTSKGGVR